MPDTLPLIFVFVAVVAVVAIFVAITARLRRGGGSMTTVALGATDAFLTQERRRAAETIVNENAGKKFVDQASGDPKQRGERRPH